MCWRYGLAGSRDCFVETDVGAGGKGPKRKVIDAYAGEFGHWAILATGSD